MGQGRPVIIDCSLLLNLNPQRLPCPYSLSLILLTNISGSCTEAGSRPTFLCPHQSLLCVLPFGPRLSKHRKGHHRTSWPLGGTIIGPLRLSTRGQSRGSRSVISCACVHLYNLYTPTSSPTANWSGPGTHRIGCRHSLAEQGLAL